MGLLSERELLLRAGRPVFSSFGSRNIVGRDGFTAASVRVSRRAAPNWRLRL